MGCAIRALVQPGAQAQQYPLSVTATGSHQRRQCHSRRPSEAKERHPARWARHTRDWSPMGPVTLNPERDSIIAEHIKGKLIQPLAV